MADAGDAIRRLLHPESIRQSARDRYPLRSPDQAEAAWFSQNPFVAGYAAPMTPGTERRVVLNPALPKEAAPYVHANEGVRHHMYESGDQPDFLVYPHQYASDAYANDSAAAKQTIVARILSGDNSLAPYTDAQRAEARRIGAAMSLAPENFHQWYARLAEKTGIDRNPDDPQHHYDYRAAYRAGANPEMEDDGFYHWPSQFKGDNHPNRYVDGIDTKYGRPR